MLRGPIVDREDELAAFTEALESSPSECSVLLVHDVSGQGKTRLIELYKDHCHRKSISAAHIDLKGGSLTPDAILRTINTDFVSIPLPRCGQSLRSRVMTPPSSGIGRNTGVGYSTYTYETTINVAGMTREEQRQWWADGASALLEDLMEHRHKAKVPFVLLLDTFEAASSDTKVWIADHLLRMATPSRVGGLLIVLAGKEVPDPSGEWEPYAQTLSLSPLKLSHWLQYAAQVKSTLNAKEIEQCFDKHRAEPLRMAFVIDTFAPGKGRNVG